MSRKPENPAKRAAHLAGLSVLMLDYLEREEIFEREEVRADADASARRKGRRRDYSFRDIVVLRAIARLLEKGISVRRLKAALLQLSRDSKFECDVKWLRYEHESVQYLVTDGKQVYFRRDGTGVTSILEGGQEAFHFVLDMAEARQSVVDLSNAQVKKLATKL